MTFAATSTTRTLAVNDRNQTSIKGLSGGVYLYPAPATHFGVSVSNNTSSTNFSVGQPGSVFVTARNDLGDRDESYRGTIHFSSTDQAAGLPADYTFTTADNGSHTFTFTPAADGGRSLGSTTWPSRRVRAIRNRFTCSRVRRRFSPSTRRQRRSVSGNPRPSRCGPETPRASSTPDTAAPSTSRPRTPPPHCRLTTRSPAPTPVCTSSPSLLTLTACGP